MNQGTIFTFRGPFGAPVEFQSSLIMLVLIMLMLSMPSTAYGFVHVAIVIAMLITSILLHELGHAWGAWVQGVPVQRVVVHGGGGYCEHALTDPRRTELIVAMGPLTNLAIWAICSLVADWLAPKSIYTFNESAYYLAAYLDIFARMNFFFFALNLLPMQPLDGGRLLFLGLLRFMDRREASRWAGQIGLVACVIYPLALIWALVNFGWIFLFFPAFGWHLALARGERLL